MLDYEHTCWSKNPKPFLYSGLTLDIIMFCKPGIKARLEYLNWSKQQ